MLKLETRSDLQRLIDDDIQESATLDYKDAAALGRSNQQRSELFKDVSAFANSAGGQGPIARSFHSDTAKARTSEQSVLSFIANRSSFLIGELHLGKLSETVVV